MGQGAISQTSHAKTSTHTLLQFDSVATRKLGLAHFIKFAAIADFVFMVYCVISGWTAVVAGD